VFCKLATVCTSVLRTWRRLVAKFEQPSVYTVKPLTTLSQHVIIPSVRHTLSRRLFFHGRTVCSRRHTCCITCRWPVVQPSEATQHAHSVVFWHPVERVKSNSLSAMRNQLYVKLLSSADYLFFRYSVNSFYVNLSLINNLLSQLYIAQIS